jgi:hydrogenase maturation protease
MTRRGVLVAGIGNIFQSDDAFGVEVALRLATHPTPPDVRVEDFGIRGMHLAYELLEGYDALVLIDAVAMGEPAGTLAIIEPVVPVLRSTGPENPPAVDAHTMDPDTVLATLAHLGGSVDKVFIVGCQPASLEEGMGLSPVVSSVLDDAVEMCRQLVSELVCQTPEPVGKGPNS